MPNVQSTGGRGESRSARKIRKQEKIKREKKKNKKKITQLDSCSMFSLRTSQLLPAVSYRVIYFLATDQPRGLYL